MVARKEWKENDKNVKERKWMEWKGNTCYLVWLTHEKNGIEMKTFYYKYVNDHYALIIIC